MAVTYGAYVALLDAAKADDDVVRRQAAHDHLATIGPMAGALDEHGNCPGDQLAAPVLARLYPEAGQPRDGDRQ